MVYPCCSSLSLDFYLSLCECVIIARIPSSVSIFVHRDWKNPNQHRWDYKSPCIGIKTKRKSHIMCMVFDRGAQSITQRGRKAHFNTVSPGTLHLPAIYFTHTYFILIQHFTSDLQFFSIGLHACQGQNIEEYRNLGTHIYLNAEFCILTYQNNNTTVFSIDNACIILILWTETELLPITNKL